jgi:antitoxin MazE6
MKVAISLPDAVFEEAERVAKRLRVPRSRLYARAVEDFVKRHRGKNVREALAAVYAQESQESEGLDPVLSELQAHALRERW